MGAYLAYDSKDPPKRLWLLRGEGESSDNGGKRLETNADVSPLRRKTLQKKPFGTKRQPQAAGIAAKTPNKKEGAFP